MDSPKLIFLTAGGAGMYCGSCMRDNTLVRHLQAAGWDISLVPLYTPIRTDEANLSVDRVFLGGITVYLRQRVPILRGAPSWLLRWMDHPAVIRKATSRQVPVDASQLGPLTLAVLQGEHGYLRQEHRNLVRWISRNPQPELINFTNLLISGSVPLLRRQLPNTRLVVTLQGDDLFLGQLVAPWRERVLRAMRELAKQIDAFTTYSSSYAQLASELFEISPRKIHIIPLGIEVPPFKPRFRDASRPLTWGFFARISPEKGFHHAIDAFLHLAKLPGMETVQLRAGGWLSAQDRAFFEAQLAKLEQANLRDRFHYVGSPESEGKARFFEGLDVFSVPTEFQEPKGIYALEALAAGLPVVQPAHGAFPELLEGCHQAVLVPPKDPQALAEAIARTLNQRANHRPEEAHQFVKTHHHAALMAAQTSQLYQRLLSKA